MRDVQVMLDADLAELYGVETKRINEAVRNNLDKFPSDFYFELSQEDDEILRSKISTSSWGSAFSKMDKASFEIMERRLEREDTKGN